MIAPARRTLAKPTSAIEGAGLFTRRGVRLTIEPGADGVRMIRDDRRGAAGFGADVGHVSPTPRRTTLAPNGRPEDGVQLVEHLLSAFVGAGLTDADVRVHGGETPLGEGCAQHVIDALDDAGLEDLPDTGAPALRIESPIEVHGKDGVSWVRFEPLGADDAPGSTVFRYELDFAPRTEIPAGACEWTLGDEAGYRERIAGSRTFGFEDEVRAMFDADPADHPLARLIPVFMNDGSVSCPLRFPDEPVRHKLLDLIGDIALAGVRPVGRVVGYRSGHALHHEAARRLRAIADTG